MDPADRFISCLGDLVSTFVTCAGCKSSDDSNNQVEVGRVTRDTHLQKSIEVTKMWPFSAILPRPLREGDQIILAGNMSADAQEFSLNLVCEHEPHTKPDNIAYHHKILFNENRTIINTKVNGVWQEETEYSMNMAEPAIVPGEEFKITLKIQQELIYAYCNGSYHSKYEGVSIPIEDIRYIQIWSGIENVTSMQVLFA